MSIQLSANAQKLQAILKENGCIWMSTAMELLFNKPEYPAKGTPNREELQRIYWQWEADAYSCNSSKPVGDQSVLFISKYSPKTDYCAQTSKAYQELRKAGIADEQNNGTNEYAIFLTDKK